MKLRHLLFLFVLVVFIPAGGLRGEDDAPDKPPLKHFKKGSTAKKATADLDEDAGTKPSGTKPKKAISSAQRRRADADDGPAPKSKRKAVGSTVGSKEGKTSDADEPSGHGTASAGKAKLKQGQPESESDSPLARKSDGKTPKTQRSSEKTLSHDAQEDNPDPPKSARLKDPKGEPGRAEPGAQAPSKPGGSAKYAPDASLEPAELAEFASAPPRVQKLIGSALELTKQNLTYTYGSSDPASGGMDCSGTIYYVLRANGFSEPPRDSSGQYAWVRKHGPFFAVVGHDPEGFEMNDLQPGDLLFWSGTYDVQRELPITHVMLYLGREKKTHKRVMFGASDGRSYQGIQRWGVSVFDLKLPTPGAEEAQKSKVRFIGYGRVPGLRDGSESPLAAVAVAEDEHVKSKAATLNTEKAGSAEKPDASAKPATNRKKRRRSSDN